MSMIPHFLDNWLTDGGEVVSFTSRPCFTLQEDFLILISVMSCVRPGAVMRLEVLRKLKKKIKYLIGNRTRDLPAFRIATQPTTLPRAPLLVFCVG
jgi:hypothetical protein